MMSGLDDFAIYLIALSSANIRLEAFWVPKMAKSPNARAFLWRRPCSGRQSWLTDVGLRQLGNYQRLSMAR
jgi:hypothetical protein